MQTKYMLIGVAVLSALVLISWLRSRRTSSPPAETPQEVSLAELSEGEQKVHRLVREVHGDAILTERFLRESGDVKVQLSFDTNKAALESLSVNLTNLARKQKDEGLSDGALKRSLMF